MSNEVEERLRRYNEKKYQEELARKNKEDEAKKIRDEKYKKSLE